MPETIITCHSNADSDALAALVGAGVLYPDACLLFPGSQEKQIQECYDEIVAPLFPCVSSRDLEPEQVKRLVVVDAHMSARLQHVKSLLEREDVEIHIWDHHPLNEDEDEEGRINAAFSRIEKVGAASTLIVEELQRRGLTLTCEYATLLAAGIYGDTGSFRYSSVTPRDFQAAAWLVGIGVDLPAVSRIISVVMGREQLKILSEMLENTEVRDIGGEILAVSSMPSEGFLDNFAMLAPRIMEIEKCSALFALATMEDKVQVVGRSSSPRVDVGEICRMLGGGGHHYAASASVKDRTLPQIRDFLLMKASVLANADENAGRLMSSPAVGVYENTSISDALSLMNRYGLKAVPVFSCKERSCSGILSQDIAAKASGHGLGHVDTSVYMLQTFQVVTASSGLQELVDIMIGGRQRLIPVVAGEDVETGKDLGSLSEEEAEARRQEILVRRSTIGVVTRTDLIRLFMGEHAAHIPPVSHRSRKERNLASILRKWIPGVCVDFLALAGEAAHDMGISAYAVGGFVRDLVMERKGLHWPEVDIDLVVEGDALDFAHRLAIHLKGRVREHKEFMTAMLTFPVESLNKESAKRGQGHFPDGVEAKVDIATARLEFYTEPGALPQVERSSIKMDLYRRDFSINAMAMRLNPGEFGQLVDFFDGQDDVRNKRIKVLHALSFVEDPTRVFRAVRFEQRYGFRMGVQCERFARNAVDDLHLLRYLSGGRITHELELMMEERNMHLAFFRMAELGILAEVHPLLAIDNEKRETIERLRKVLEWYSHMYLPEKSDLLMIMLLVLSRRAPASDLEQVLARLQFSEKRKRDTLFARGVIISARQGLARWEKNDGPVSDLHRLLARAPLEVLLYLLTREDKPELHEKLTRYIYQGRQMKAGINGDDLVRLGLKPGPMFGRILEEVLAACLDDETLNREKQLELAANLAVRFTLEEEGKEVQKKGDKR